MLDEGQEEPITLYFWTTPNGFKISIMLEEIGAPYRVEFIDINKGDQFAPVDNADAVAAIGFLLQD